MNRPIAPTVAQTVVITSIFPPTEAVYRFAAVAGWRLLVVGDRKTPADWHVDGVTLLTPADQQASGFALAERLPWNHYCRKMVGYLRAVADGATIIADTDDDNLPKPGWAFPPFQLTDASVSPGGRGFVNVYANFTAQRIWPRGFALNRLTDPRAVLAQADFTPAPASVGVWQGLADGDPDVDAIYRLTDNTPCTFDDRGPVVLAAGTVCPFNSQNTAFRRDAFPLLYLPALVTFRYTDILRGLVAQPILWAAGLTLGFTKATVVQERNPHDYLKDFESEIPCYLHAERVIDVVGKVIRPAGSIAQNLRQAYAELVKVGIVPAAELPILDAWLADLAALGHE